MFDLSAVSESVLGPVTSVVTAILENHAGLDPTDLMVVGAQCRDILHAAQGHHFITAATHDLDLALALRSRQDYSDVVAGFRTSGSSGIRYDIAGSMVDLLPFGGIEDPVGVATPTERGEPLSVWGFAEVHANAVALPLSGSLDVRLPTPAGYAATKLVAWLDRREPRDAADLALIAYWYTHDPTVEAALWEEAAGDSVVVDEDFNVDRACVRQLGIDIAAQVGPVRRGELAERWSGDDEGFVREFRLTAMPDWTGGRDRRRELIAALTRGIAGNPPQQPGFSR